MPGYCLQSAMQGSPLARPAHNIYMQNVSLRWAPWEHHLGRENRKCSRGAHIFCVPHPRVIFWWPQATDVRESQQCPGEAGQTSHKLRVSHNLTHRISHHIVTGRMEHHPAVRLTYNLDKTKYVLRQVMDSNRRTSSDKTNFDTFWVCCVIIWVWSDVTICLECWEVSGV